MHLKANRHQGGIMRLPHFEYLTPKTLEEACSLLAEHPRETSPLAGGTDLLVKMKQRRIVPRYVLNLKGIAGMDYITFDENDGLRVGALATIQSLKNSVVVKRHCGILAAAAAIESSVQVRNIATLGGNIANASPAADAPLALITLGASLLIARSGGQREVLLEDFFTGPGKTVLQPGEIIREIRVPRLLPRTGGAYLKHAVRRTDIAIVSCAVVLTLIDDLCDDVRIGLGSVGPTAFRTRKAEGLLKGKKITGDVADAAAQAAVDESRPIDDIRGYAEYRAKTVLAITRQAIMQALQDARLGGI
jgi:aerobic carbon-monoxide dehydrogenase medium subunit